MMQVCYGRTDCHYVVKIWHHVQLHRCTKNSEILDASNCPFNMNSDSSNSSTYFYLSLAQLAFAFCK